MSNAATNIAPQPYAGELTVLDDAENQLADLRAKYGAVPNYATKDGYKVGKQAIQALTKMRTSTDKARLAITRPHRDFIKQVNQRAKGLVGEVEQLEAPHREAKREVDEAEQRKKEERIARLRERLSQEVNSFLDSAAGLDSTGLADLIGAAEGIDTTGYFDVTDEAEDEKARVIRALTDQHQRALHNEQMAAERESMARERAELERLREQQAPTPAPAAPEAQSHLSQVEAVAPQARADDFSGDFGEPEPYDKALEDLQAAGLEVSAAVAALSAIRAGSVRHVSFSE